MQTPDTAELPHEPDLARDQHAAWQCIVRLLTFLSPLLALLALVEYSLWRTGDNWPIWLAYQTQHEIPTEVVYDRDFFSEQLGVYKIAGLRDKQPKFVILGSSRVLQIRDFCFAPREAEFYNAGGMLQNMQDWLEYVDMVARQELPRPDWVLVGLDPWWLKTELRPGKSWLRQGEETYQAVAHVEAFRRTLRQRRYADLFMGLSAPRELYFHDQRVIGGLALRHGSGFRKDGSRLSPEIVLNDYLKQPGYRDRESPPVIDRIRNHWSQFSLPAEYDEQKEQALIKALDQLQQLGVETWVLFPPFAPECLIALEQNAELQAWWSRFRHALPERLKQSGHQVISAFSVKDVGLTDHYLLDGFHPSEVFMTQLMRQACETAPAGSVLRTLDTSSLPEKIRQAKTPLSFE